MGLLLQDSGAVLALLNIAPGVSRVHASRRFFERLQSHGIDIPVIHQRSFPAGEPFAPTSLREAADDVNRIAGLMPLHACANTVLLGLCDLQQVCVWLCIWTCVLILIRCGSIRRVS